MQSKYRLTLHFPNRLKEAVPRHSFLILRETSSNTKKTKNKNPNNMSIWNKMLHNLAYTAKLCNMQDIKCNLRFITSLNKVFPAAKIYSADLGQ